MENIQPVKVVVKSDFVGNDLTLGTRVIIMERGYRNFKIGILTSMANVIGHVTMDDGRKVKQRFNQMIRTDHEKDNNILDK